MYRWGRESASSLQGSRFRKDSLTAEEGVFEYLCSRAFLFRLLRNYFKGTICQLKEKGGDEDYKIWNLINEVKDIEILFDK